MGVPKFPKLGLPQLWGPITLHANLLLRWGLKQSCSPCWDLFNGMLHTTYTQGNWVDSRLLMIGSQTTNLTPDFSFGHNLCIRCPNGSCEPILDIYVSIIFQWYKEILNPLVLTPVIVLWKFGSPPRLQIPKMEAPLGVWGFIPSHTFTLGLPLLACNLTSHCLGHKPKVRVATIGML